MSEYRFAPSETSSDLIEQYSRLLSLVFPDAHLHTRDYLTWLYRDNPAGKVVGQDAWLNNELVAHYATIPVSYSFFGRDVLGLLSLNTATREDHQGKGLFTKLAEETYIQGQASSFEFVIGVANQNSTHGFVNKLGFQLVCPLDAQIGFGSIEPTTRKLKVQSVWDDARLKWRLSNPAHRYFKRGDGVYTNAGILGIKALITSRFGGRDLPIEERRSPTLRIGLNQFSKRGNYVNIPNRLRPSPLNLIYRNLQKSNQYLSSSDVGVELLDFDAY